MDGLPFDRNAAVRFGWETVKSRFFFFFWLMILALAGFVALNLTETWLPDSILRFVVILCSNVWGMMFAIGTALIALKICDGQEARVSDLFVEPGVLWAYIVAAVLSGLFVALGIVLLIVPGVIFYLKLLFYPYFIVENYGGAINSMQSSWNLTVDMKWELFKFAFQLVLINLLGALCLGVGLLWTVPLSWLATAHVYRQLAPKAQSPATAV